MGLKHIVHVNFLGCFIVLLACFRAFCSAAPAKQIEDEAVLSWLKYWTQQLGESVWETFNTYDHVRFGDRPNRQPYLQLGVLRGTIAENTQTPKNVSNSICRQLLEFTTPVYLAYYDESQRSDSNAELTKLLLNVSVILNSTTEMAQYHHVRKFRDANQPLTVESWSRDFLYARVNDYKVKAGDGSSINELRTWATFSELTLLSPKLQDLFEHI